MDRPSRWSIRCEKPLSKFIPISRTAEADRRNQPSRYSDMISTCSPTRTNASWLSSGLRFRNMVIFIMAAIPWSEIGLRFPAWKGAVGGVVDAAGRIDQFDQHSPGGLAIHTDVAGLRSVSLAESGRLELVIGDVDLAAELEDMRPILSSMLSPAGFELEMTLEAGVVRADAARIRQAVVALVDNARRHASPCTLRLAVEFTRSEAVITVADKGPGLPPKLERSAFRQFVRGTKNSGGSGLGLSVVQAIARAHGGDAIYQRANDRSLFRILLPAPKG